MLLAVGTGDAFVGRAAELAAFDAALARAQAGTGRVLLLVGPPGIGKTRLAQECAQRARVAGAEVLTGRCYEDPGAPAFWPWTQVVRAYAAGRDAATLAGELGAGAADVAALVPELHDHVPGLAPPPQVGEAQARFRLFEAVTTGLARAAARRPVVLVLEDLHGADASSLMLLRFLARSVRTAALVVVATLRDAALAPTHPLAATLGELVREQVSEHLELVGLGPVEVAELMERMTGTPTSPALAAAVQARTDGNPLYVTEVVRPLVTASGFASDEIAIPKTVRNAVAAHLGTISSAARVMLTRAALFGREFRVDLIARISECAVEEILGPLDEAVNARIVSSTDDPGCYRFTHVLFAESLVEALPAIERVSLHSRAALTLMRDYRAESATPEIAHHWYAAGPAGDPQQAIAWARRAGERSLAMLAYEDAAQWHRRGLTALGWEPAADSSVRAELLLGLGEASKRAGDVAAAKEAFEEAAALGRILESPEILTRAALGYAPTIAWGEHARPVGATIDLLEESVAAWHDQDSALHACALTRLGIALLFGDPVRKAELVARGVAMARRVGDQATLRYALAAWLTSYQDRFDSERRLAVATELLRFAEHARDLETEAVARLWRAVHLMECGDFGGWLAELEHLARVADELRQPVWHFQLGLQRVTRAMVEGAFDEAEPLIQATYEWGRGSGSWGVLAHRVTQTFLLSMLRGEPDASEYRAHAEQHPDPMAMCPVAWAAAERGALGEARALLERFAVDDFAAARKDVLVLVAGFFLAETCAAVGRVEGTEHLAAMLEPHRRRWIVWAEGAPLGPVTQALGLLWRTAGRLDAAAVAFEDAIAECRRVESPPFLARALYEYGVLLQARAAGGDAARAEACLAEAAEIAAAIGMQGIVRKTAALMSSRVAIPAVPIGAVAPTAAVFRREEDYWVIAYARRTVRLRPSRGLEYLAVLLRAPGREVHVTALVAAGDAPGVAIDVAGEGAVAVRATLDGRGEAGIDARARAAYRARLAALGEELAEAERHQDLGRAERLRAERDALEREVMGALGARRKGRHAERARVTVTKGIGAAIARIAAVHPALGAHLRATVRRGYFCAYVPDPRQPIVWEG